MTILRRLDRFFETGFSVLDRRIFIHAVAMPIS